MMSEFFPERVAIFWRLPIIRHVRWAYWAREVDRWYAMWGSLGMLPVNRHHDEVVLDQIWRGDR